LIAAFLSQKACDLSSLILPIAADCGTTYSSMCFYCDDDGPNLSQWGLKHGSISDPTLRNEGARPATEFIYFDNMVAGSSRRMSITAILRILPEKHHFERGEGMKWMDGQQGRG